MSQTKAPAAKKVAKTRTPKTTSLDIGRAGVALLTKLAAKRFAKNAAEREFKPLDAAFKLLYADAAAQLELGDTINIVSGNKPLGRVTCERGGRDVDYDLLMEAYPEAYEQCVKPKTVVKFYSA